MTKSDWRVHVLDTNDISAGVEPCVGLIAARAPFEPDADLEAGPVLAVVRTGTGRDRILIDLGSGSGGWTTALGAPGAMGRPWLRIGAEDLPQDSSKVRIFRFEVDWDVAVTRAGQQVTCILVWRMDSDTLNDLWAQPDDPDGPELLSFLSKRFPVFRSAQETGGGATTGGSNMLMTAVGS
jgi:hypothetical protein